METPVRRRGNRGGRPAAPSCEGESAWGGGGGAAGHYAPSPAVRLTGRERWIVSELVKQRGAPNKVIAHTLNISPNTLRNHLASIYAKVGVRRRVELVLYAMEHGLDRAVEPRSPRGRPARDGSTPAD